MKINKKKNDIPKGSIILKPLPKSIGVEDVDGFVDTIRDLLLSAKNENWDYTINKKYNYCYHNYELIINSNDIEINALVYLDSDKADLGRFHIKSEEGGLKRFLSASGTGLDNDLLLFLWDYIIEWESNNNTKTYNNYEEIFQSIRKNLKSLNRDRKLNDLFK